jgi:hypothetical protein
MMALQPPLPISPVPLSASTAQSAARRTKKGTARINLTIVRLIRAVPFLSFFSTVAEIPCPRKAAGMVPNSGCAFNLRTRPQSSLGRLVKDAVPSSIPPSADMNT